MKKLLISLFVPFLLMFSACIFQPYGPIKANSLTDGLDGKYEVVIPENLSTFSHYAGLLYFTTTIDITFDIIKQRFIEDDYIVSETTFKTNYALLIGFNEGDKIVYPFILSRVLEYNEDDSLFYFIDNLTDGRLQVASYSFPIHFDFTNYNFIYDDDHAFLGVIYETTNTFDELVSFYDHALSDVIEVNYDDKSLLIKASIKYSIRNTKEYCNISYYIINDISYIKSELINI